MKSNKNKKVFNAVWILAIGAILTAGGLFIWQNQFNVIFSPQAAAANLEAVIVLGEQKGIEIEVDDKVKYIDRAENSNKTSSLRDQAVLGYNDLGKPVTGHVYFLVTVGAKEYTTALKNNDSLTTVSTRTFSEVSTLLELLISRPGVFPKGFTIFLSQFPDSTSGTGNIAQCTKELGNSNSRAQVRDVYTEIASALANIRTIYPQYVKLVDTTEFDIHALGSSKSWFSSCLTLNTDGQEGLNSAFSTAIKELK